MSGIWQDTKYRWGWGQWFIFFTSSPMDMARIRGLILKTRGIQLRGQKDFKKLNKLHENCEITCHRRLPELLIECFRLIIYLITFQPHLPPTSPLLQHLFLLLLPRHPISFPPCLTIPFLLHFFPVPQGTGKESDDWGFFQTYPSVILK